MAVQVGFDPTGACANLDNNVLTFWDCSFQTSFLNDPIMIGLFMLFLISYMGLKLNLPFSVMFLFGWGFLYIIYTVYNIQYLIAPLILGAAFVAVNLVTSYFKGPKNAVQ